MALYLGIDIGGTKIETALMDRSGAVLSRDRVPTDPARGGHAVLHSAIQLAQSLIENAPERPVAVGIGAGGQIDSESGKVLYATDILPGWAGINLKSNVSESLNLPVFVDNDVNALAVGESMFGVAKEKKVVVFLALGTGVGGAVLIDGSIFRGAHSCGAELGHMIMDISESARTDLGGAKGTFEAYVSGAGLVQTYLEIVGEQDGGITGYDVLRAAEADPYGPASFAIKRTGEYLGIGLASLGNIFDPDLFVIGGGISSLGEKLLAPARRTLKEKGIGASANTPVMKTSLGENASAIGAASLAIGRSAYEIKS
jgi:glucokinase